MSQGSTGAARTERWKREDGSPRLCDEVPSVTALRLELTEHFNGRAVLDSRRVTPIIVARAAARFEVPCSDPRCEDGGHDLTRHVLTELRAFRSSFAGQDRCGGYVGDRPCDRTLRFIGYAEFASNAKGDQHSDQSSSEE